MKSKVLVLSAAVMLTVFCAGCSKSGVPAGATTATVDLKDGSTFSGTVTKSDSSAITLQAPTGEVRTYPMTQVDSVKYDIASAPATTTTAATTTTTTTDTSSGAPPSAAQSVPPPAPAAPPRIIPAGTRISVRNSETISSEAASAGQTFPAVVTASVIGDDGAVAIPRGSNARLIVRSAKGQGKIQGRSELAIDLDSVTVNGVRYRMQTHDIVEQGKQGLGTNKRSAEFTGGGAVLGTIIGAVAGGGKGAAIGAGAGAGAGLATQAMTRGKAVRIPAESVLSFRLEAAVEITPE